MAARSPRLALKGLMSFALTVMSLSLPHPRAVSQAQGPPPDRFLVRLTKEIEGLTWLTPTTLLVTTVSPSLVTNIAIVTLPEGEIRPLAGGRCGTPSPWIPSAGMRGDVWVLDLRSATRRPVTTGLHASCVAWSPDGRRLAVVRESPSRSTDEILILAADSGRVPQTIASGDMDLGSPAWTPDSRKVAFSVERVEFVSMRPPAFALSVSRIDIFDVQTRRRAPYLDLARTDVLARNLAFRPDGQVLLYVAGPQIFAYDGTSSTLVTTGSAPACHPTGQSFIFARGYDCARGAVACAGDDLYVMNY